MRYKIHFTYPPLHFDGFAQRRKILHIKSETLSHDICKLDTPPQTRSSLSSLTKGKYTFHIHSRKSLKAKEINSTQKFAQASWQSSCRCDTHTLTHAHPHTHICGVVRLRCPNSLRPHTIFVLSRLRLICILWSKNIIIIFSHFIMFPMCCAGICECVPASVCVSLWVCVSVCVAWRTAKT